MHSMIEEARRKASLLADIARCRYGTPSYEYFKRDWLDAVDELEALEAQHRDQREKRQEQRESKGAWKGE
jgi:hypothetical protein